VVRLCSLGTQSCIGQVLSVTNPTGSSTYAYDGTDADGKVEHRGMPTGLTLSGVGSFAAAYDVNGSLVTQTMPAGVREDLTYDESGALSSLVYSGDVATETGTVTGEWLAYSRTYDAAGRVATEVTPDGVTDAGFSKSYGYDRAGRLTSVLSAIDTAGGPGCNSRSYVFDKQGNRTALTDAPATGACSSAGGTTTTWAYDAFSRQLTGANGSGTYVYDAFGRQTTLPSTDAPNPAGGDITIGYYDTDAVASMTQGTSPTVTESFTLDPAGRRLQQQTSDGTTTTTVNSHYGNSSDNPTWATQISGSTTATTRYLGAIAGGLSATSTTQGSTTTSSLTLVDPGGSIVATVDIPATGNADSITGYATSDEYGAAASYVDTGVLQYGWEGGAQRAVSGTGLTLMGARVYSPAIGRFTSADRIPGGNSNAYNYPNSPTTSSDLSGLAWSAWKSRTTTTKFNSFLGCGSQTVTQKIDARSNTYRQKVPRSSATRLVTDVQYKLQIWMPVCMAGFLLGVGVSYGGALTALLTVAASAINPALGLAVGISFTFLGGIIVAALYTCLSKKRAHITVTGKNMIVSSAGCVSSN
jgi:large repetitive protein